MSGLCLLTNNIRICACRQFRIMNFNPSRTLIYPLSLMFSQVTCRRSKSTKVDSASVGFEDLDKPIKYTTSAAAEWTAENTHGGHSKDMPWFQPFSVVGSVGVFLLYFCVLREENDMDELMGKSLYERVPGLERQQLEVILQYNIEHGLPTEDIIKRMAEVKEKEEFIKSQFQK